MANTPTLAQLQLELAQLKQAGFTASVQVIETEIKRRKHSRYNGPRVQFDDAKHVERREYMRRLRSAQSTNQGESLTYITE